MANLRELGSHSNKVLDVEQEHSGSQEVWLCVEGSAERNCRESTEHLPCRDQVHLVFPPSRMCQEHGHYQLLCQETNQKCCSKELGVAWCEEFSHTRCLGWISVLRDLCNVRQVHKACKPHNDVQIQNAGDGTSVLDCWSGGCKAELPFVCRRHWRCQQSGKTK